MEHRKVSRDFVTMVWQMVMSQVTVTVCHMTRVTWGPWESKHIATVVKCISSREMSENSIEFSLSNSEQRDSWLNSGHWTLDTDTFWYSTRLVQSCITIGRPRLRTTLAFYLAPLCRRAPSAFQTLGPSRECCQSHRQSLYEARR